ncbi:SH3 domain-containing protein [Fodinisporobacter ferrooxydans]|uniref:SH3 domain-containing protein n=1 Tax=Fodinisporobacter ferrooxydans TaxID=2901836 RepID=A0ABY4CJU1_9BACL|nr:SH3 domain-containing protein [Alicyclobacillaceae bacterium MYW30-H2]
MPQESFYVGKSPAFIQDGQIYVRNSSHQFYRRDPDGDHLVGTYEPEFETLDLRLKSPIQASAINAFIASHSPNSPLIGLGQAFVDAQSKFGVNAEYLAAHAILESNYGTSVIARDKNNLFGYQAYDVDPYGSAAHFDSFTDAINYEAYFVRKQYLDANGQWFGGSPTLDGMNVHYASDPYWAEKIAGIMNQMYAYQTTVYSQEQPLPLIAAKPAGPTPDSVQSVIQKTVPMTASGVTTDQVNFRQAPSLDSSIYRVLSGGTKLAVIGHSGAWYEVKVGSQTGWIFQDYIQLTNDSSDSANQNTGSSPAANTTSGNGSNANTAGTTGSGSPTGIASPEITTPPVPTTPPISLNGDTTDNVNFRKGPSLTAATYGVLSKGTKVTILGLQQDWYHVQINDQVGWINKNYVELNRTHQGLTVFVNGTEQSYNPSPIIENDRTLVPLRAVFETLGAKINWNQATQTVTAFKGQTNIVLKIGSSTAYVNGKPIQLDVQAHTLQNRTMVPLRFVSDALGANISWDGSTESIFITS